MKLFLRPCQQFYGNSMAPSRALLFSTQAPTRQPSPITPLKRMIMGVGDPKASVVPILENWVQEGNQIKHSQLRKIIRDLGITNRFNYALQISQWMGDKGGYELSAADFAAQLELTASLHYIQVVERYFDAIPYNLKGYKVYCALLRSYAHHGRLKKGEATIEKLRELGFIRNASAYNVMLSYYYKTGEYNKMNILAEEMREKGINYNRITYDLLLKGNRMLNIKKMEKVLKELEADPLVNIDWYHYFLAAQGYRYANKVKKTLKMLKKSEESIEGNLNWSAFEDLITLYGQVGSKDGVYHLWSLYKPKKGFCYRAYSCMITSLIEADDPDGATRIWEEWLSKYIRIPKATWEKEVYFEFPLVLIRLTGLEKAEAIVFRLRESGIEPDAATLNELAGLYCQRKQMDKGVETLMKAISVSKPGWEPYPTAIVACFDYFGRQGDDAAKEELYNMLKERCGVPTWLPDDYQSYLERQGDGVARE